MPRLNAMARLPSTPTNPETTAPSGNAQQKMNEAVASLTDSLVVRATKTGKLSMIQITYLDSSKGDRTLALLRKVLALQAKL